jgi:hypothetical protein
MMPFTKRVLTYAKVWEQFKLKAATQEFVAPSKVTCAQDPHGPWHELRPTAIGSSTCSKISHVTMDTS